MIDKQTRERVRELKEKVLSESEACGGVIDVYKMEAGLYIELACDKDCYELQVGTPEFGAVIIAHPAHFPHRDKCAVKGSYVTVEGEKIYIPKLIVKDAEILLHKTHSFRHVTPPVRRAVIRGRNDQFSYSLWGE